ncbi:ParB-like nuclease family protein [Methylovirgula ligni]|uniref:ParB-like nuclease family protein n=1 Tax=Methylovirgula ligni TaxID=569860 RepID=A0A3D9YL48_9HYPH|nr:ParB N-terminal domain-containing protein [Methylovirgula ligni]REF83276.1 ParB-like nuclease family protein [Methylovirgula ligni]
MSETSGPKLRTITRIDARDVRPAKSFGLKPECVWIDIVLLRVDETYQRPIDKQGRAQIALIAETFDWRKFAPVIVADIGGGLYAIVDGQHRAHAAALCNIRSVPCYVIAAAPEEQADCFAAINGQVIAIRTQNLWKARRAAGHPEAAALDRIATAEGVSLVWHNLSTLAMEPAQTCALNAIVRAVRRYNEKIAGLALFALRSTRTRAKRSFLTAQWIEATVAVLAEHPEWHDRALISARLGKIDLAEREADIRAARAENPALSGRALAEAAIFIALEGVDEVTA